ncbi:DUF1802 family protein [Blastopirellula marina]|uniref:DUF1802 family protein n=1 Tax=Blastopirellula marina DSM 3645 TaxID=314230 RepID=A3ZT36_9BACT|nr:DUF1802 family protein [Blastopirellula marina]EAQ80464.1 hypothetical protein DSM3645_11482 [Blastopirellula marina DSM 3645]
MNEANCPYVMKEWDVVCDALRAGRQHLLLRKGGIREQDDQFRAEHDAFWFWPTRFHQSPDQLSSDGQQLLAQLREKHAGGNRFAVDLLAVVEDVRYITQEALLDKLTGMHILAADTVRTRFHYREPGLYLFLVRIFAAPQVQLYVETPEIAGCKSWIELPDPPSSEGLMPVINDETFAVAQAKFEALFA